MGYDLSIVRKSNWDDPKEPSSITLEEWLAYANSDDELRLNETDEPAFFEWTAYPYANEDGLPWFSYYQGLISTKNPNLWVIRKLLTIAQALHAKVIGEEGEEYDESFLDSIS